jgi:hypothetical protein
VAIKRTPLADHSGGTARDLHPLPYSLRRSGAPDAYSGATDAAVKRTVSVSWLNGQAARDFLATSAAIDKEQTGVAAMPPRVWMRPAKTAHFAAGFSASRV